MPKTVQIVDRIRDLISRHNRELGIEALVKILLGAALSLFVFGLVFLCVWFLGSAIAHSLNLKAWQFGALVAGLFIAVATWSAWRRVNPLAGLKPLSDQELLMMLIAHETLGTPFVSPRHSVAGAALLLIGGPASVLEGFAAWAWRIRGDRSMIEEAASLLSACRTNFPIEKVRGPGAALLLKRLALIKIVPNGDSSTLASTEKGRRLISISMKENRKQSKKGVQGIGANDRFDELEIIDDYLSKWDRFANGNNVLVPFLNENKDDFEAALTRLLEKEDPRAPARLVFYAVVQVGGSIFVDSPLGRAAATVLGNDCSVTSSKQGDRHYFAGDLFFWWQGNSEKYEAYPLFEEWSKREFAQTVAIPMYQSARKRD